MLHSSTAAVSLAALVLVLAWFGSVSLWGVPSPPVFAQPNPCLCDCQRVTSSQPIVAVGFLGFGSGIWWSLLLASLALGSFALGTLWRQYEDGNVDALPREVRP